MTRALVFVACLIGLGIMLGSSAVSGQNVIVNGSFETGTLSGWTASPASGGGAINVVTTCETPDCQGAFSPYSPKEGSRFALLTPGDQNVATVLSQAVLVPAGTIVSGWVFFADIDDSPFCDTGTLGVLLNGAPFTGGGTVFTASACDGGVCTLNLGSTPWTFFQIQVPTAGIITISAAVTNLGSSTLPSRLGLDGVRFDAPDPAPTATTLVPTATSILVPTSQPAATPTRIAALAPQRPPGGGITAMLGGGSSSNEGPVFNPALTVPQAPAVDPIVRAAGPVSVSAFGGALRPPNTGDAGLALPGVRAPLRLGC